MRESKRGRGERVREGERERGREGERERGRGRQLESISKPRLSTGSDFFLFSIVFHAVII